MHYLVKYGGAGVKRYPGTPAEKLIFREKYFSTNSEIVGIDWKKL